MSNQQVRTAAATVLVAFAVASCSTVAGTAIRAPVPINAAGLPQVFVRPCEQVPPLVLRQQLLDPSPAVASKHTTRRGTETRTCTYRSADRRQHVTIIASNSTLDHEQADRPQAHGRDLILGGRRAVSFELIDPTPPNACEIDIAATTGIYGVQLSAASAEYSPYRDCASAAQHYAEAFLPYLPF
ncbi:Protein of uncharacterised function (DUF3558) [Mycobacteroides abscessus subsp. abscessus]|uniref:DUF3558 family protein n=1 Tax=Mycobacteroides abscessus TaxID=36809 RepID=UPI00092A77D1|nr:DUF3558 family protein [Mycobacteroides abscessus]SHU73652.1 Protein of uncharacterised function (DUF3558) [Mycobacteroides abscessus subsp. abscessus]